MSRRRKTWVREGFQFATATWPTGMHGRRESFWMEAAGADDLVSRCRSPVIWGGVLLRSFSSRVSTRVHTIAVYGKRGGKGREGDAGEEPIQPTNGECAYNPGGGTARHSALIH